MATAVASPVPALQNKGEQFSHAAASYLSKTDQYYKEIARRQLPEATGNPDAIEYASRILPIVASIYPFEAGLCCFCDSEPSALCPLS